MPSGIQELTAAKMTGFWDTLLSSTGLDSTKLPQLQALLREWNKTRFLGGVFEPNARRDLELKISSIMNENAPQWKNWTAEQRKLFINLGGAIWTTKTGQDRGDIFGTTKDEPLSAMAADAAFYNDVLPLMTPEQAGLAMTSTDGAEEALRRAFGFTQDEAGNNVAPAPSTSSADASNQQAIDGIMRELQAQYAKLTGDITQDPSYRALVGAGTAAGQYGANAQGLRSGEGLGLRGVAASASKAAQPYVQNRDALAQQYLNLASTRDLGLGNLDVQRGQLELGQEQLSLQAQQQQNQTLASLAAYQQQQSQGIGGAIGAGIGALGFIASPAVGAATMSAGAAIGGSIGGMTVGSPSLGSYTPTYNSGRGGYRGGWS